MPHLSRLALAAVVAGLTLSPLPALASLDATQTRVLQALGVTVVLPAVTPPGVKLSRIVAQAPTGQDPFNGPTYAAIYEGGGQAFAIESTTGEVGDLPGEPRAWFSAKALQAPKVPLHFQAVDDGGPKSWLSGWVEYRGHFYRFAGAHYARRHLSDQVIADREVDAAWAKRIADSLRPVKL